MIGYSSPMGLILGFGIYSIVPLKPGLNFPPAPAAGDSTATAVPGEGVQPAGQPAGQPARR